MPCYHIARKPRAAASLKEERLSRERTHDRVAGQRLRIPEYRLRRLIHDRWAIAISMRCFWRLSARRGGALPADETKAHLPILTDCPIGRLQLHQPVQSRVRELKGMAPSEFRINAARDAPIPEDFADFRIAQRCESDAPLENCGAGVRRTIIVCGALWNKLVLLSWLMVLPIRPWPKSRRSGILYSFIRVTSDYRASGISSSDRQPALLASLYWAAPRQFFAGVWYSAIDLTIQAGASASSSPSMEGAPPARTFGSHQGLVLQNA